MLKQMQMCLLPKNAASLCSMISLQMPVKCKTQM
jgi:hypothetical protein